MALKMSSGKPFCLSLNVFNDQQDNPGSGQPFVSRLHTSMYHIAMKIACGYSRHTCMGWAGNN